MRTIRREEHGIERFHVPSSTIVTGERVHGRWRQNCML